jgi:hypothetical protein
MRKKLEINIFIIEQIYKHVMYHYNIVQESIGIASKVMPKLSVSHSYT